MRAVVTGGAGFVGSTLVDVLVSRGHEVLVLDNLCRGRRENLDAAVASGVRLSTVDVRDAVGVRDAIRVFRAEVVFHLAAQIDVRSSMADPAADADVNVVGSVNVLAAATEAGATRVVLSSTGGAIYGETTLVPTPETVTPDPESGYGLSKLTAERYAAWFGKSRGLDVVTLRYGNVYGPRQDPRGDAGVVALYCDAALAPRDPVVFGDGLQTRDFVFVDDIAYANLAAATASGLSHRVYNIGTGIEITVLDLAEAVRDAAGISPGRWQIAFRPARPGEVRRSCLDVSRARGELIPKGTTSLSTGIRRTLKWMKPATGRYQQMPS